MDIGNCKTATQVKKENSVKGLLDIIIANAYSIKNKSQNINMILENMPMPNELCGNATEDYDIMGRLRRLNLVLGDIDSVLSDSLSKLD